jgi:hypothetical protein
MSDIPGQRSEVARLLEAISAEYEAAQRGLSGLAQGISEHRFITRRMERIGELHAELHTLLGDEAIVLIATQLNQTPDSEQPTSQEREI